LIATSETPNSAPAAAPSSSPSARSDKCRRVEIRTSIAPVAKTAPSTAISAASEARGGWVAPPPVTPITTSPAAVIVTPTHCRRPETEAEVPLGEHGENDKPAGEDRLHDRQRRQRERRRAAPTRESRPSTRSQTTWSERDRSRSAADGEPRIGGASAAPRCLNRNATLVATAEASASSSPRIMLRESRVPRRTSLAAAARSPQA
jgi:hypothetical protein